MIIPIRILGDPVLKTPAKPVEDFDDGLRRLAQDMLETMYDAPGVGLAGPQVGISLRLFVFDDGATGPSFMANPELHPPHRNSAEPSRGHAGKGSAVIGMHDPWQPVFLKCRIEKSPAHARHRPSA